MSIEFETNLDDDVVLITAVGDISDEEMKAMRIKTLEVLEETGIKNFVVDMAKVTSFLERSTLRTYEMGKEFTEMHFPLSMKTAVILPRDKKVRAQAEFLHIVELNRARPPMKYVLSYIEALTWFKS